MKFLLLVLAALLFGCQPEQKPAADSAAAENRPPTVRIAVVLDKSGSATRNRIPPLRLEHFEPLLDVLRQRGGELAMGRIQEDSNLPLERLRIDPPPPPPPPLPNNLNPFEVEKVSQHDEAQKKYERSVEQRRQTLEEDILDFRNRLQPLLDAPANAQRSDIGQAVTRTELFLQEPTRHPHTVKYAVLITDGADNVTRQLPPLDSGATYVVVNGSGVLGVLDALTPRAFESPIAAFDYVSRLASEGGPQQ
jgi:hypothetical protein